MLMDDMDYYEIQVGKKTNVNGQGGPTGSQQLAPGEQAKQMKNKEIILKYNNKIHLGEMDLRAPKMSQQVKNSLRNQINPEVQSKTKDKKDRATVENVLDPRTMTILTKLLKNGLLSEINGCVSTGKEANVYHAQNTEKKEYAVKVYKTSILVFKDRDRYVQGEFRFRHMSHQSNPRKMIKMWAEKEFRNLKRIRQSNIPCPEPVLVKSNVLVIEFIGRDGDAAPRLRDA